jgi:metal-responsive CopG/Arc/MetJ family transcriptional regulator
MKGKKKFTTTLDEELVKEIKKIAIDLDCSANELIEEGIHLFLKKYQKNSSRTESRIGSH